MRLWCYLGRFHKKDGRFRGYSVQEIEAHAGWHGKSGELMDALKKVGFFEKIGQDHQAHDWLDHNGHIYPLHLRAKANAEKRWAKYREDKAFRNDATSNAIAQEPSNAGSNAPALPAVQDLKELKTTLPFVSPVPVEKDRDPQAGEVNGNVISKAPESKPEKPKALTLDEIELVDRVVHFTNDLSHRPLFQKAVRIMGAGLVEQAMAQVKAGYAEGTVEKKSAALIGTINQWLLEYQRNAKRNGENERPGEYTNLKKRTRTIKLP